jgi:phosphoadenosine phosphosulfate reductase
MTEQLQWKVDRAIRLIQSAAGDDVVEVSYSGGKDSDVILELAKMADIEYRAIYKNTTIDPPGTIKHCRDNGVEILQPKITFFKLVEKKGMPTRRARFCCEKLKEYKVLDKAIQGIRRSESTARAQRYNEDDPIICRIYGAKKNHVSVILPILSWTDEDVAEFIQERGIKCHPLYYDEQGNFHPERRLGCMGCPLRSDAGLSEFKDNPKLLRQIVKASKVWWDTHPHLNSHKKFGTIYGLVAHNLFYKSYADWQAADHNLFERKDWKKELEQYFNIELP